MYLTPSKFGLGKAKGLRIYPKPLFQKEEKDMILQVFFVGPTRVTITVLEDGSIVIQLEPI